MKFISIVLVSIVSLFANTHNIPWQKQLFYTQMSQNSSTPLKDVQKEIAVQVNRFLQPRNAINIEALIPSKVMKPTLPAKVVKPIAVKKVHLTQGKYEPKSDFKKRVEQENQAYIKKSQEQKEKYEQAIRRSGTIKTKLKQMLALVNKGDTIYFYYSGHGIPVARESNEPYILPKDIDPSYINDEKFFKLQNIYKRLSSSKASKVIAVVDSCFSGATDGKVLLKGVAAARLVPKKIHFNMKKMVVLTAGRDRQYSNMYPKQEQRLFSYFVMDALLQNKKNVGYLYKNVYRHVQKESRKMGNLKLQQPTILGNKNLSF